MIKVSGEFKLVCRFDVKLDMTEEEFDALPEKEREVVLDRAIDYSDCFSSSELDDFNGFDIWEVEEA